jgi:3-oxoacyl-[acyl-carrier-protein] synthase-3
MQNLPQTRIVSFGYGLPEKKIPNKDLEVLLNTTDEWIQQRSGIKERRWVSGAETTLSMAVESAKDCLAKAKTSIEEVDAIIFGSLVTDYVFPGTGCLLQHALGGKRPIPALDIRNQCSGFLYALSIANAWIRSGSYKKILICASEVQSPRLDKSPEGRDVSVLFGDGAGSCLVEAVQVPSGSRSESQILDIEIFSQGEYADILCLKGPGSHYDVKRDKDLSENRDNFPRMEGRTVFKHAVERMTEVVRSLLAKNKLQPADVNFVVAHQANMRINSMVLDQLGIPWERTHHTLDRLGNTTMATIPLTMGEAVDQGKIKRGDLVVLVAFGAGFTWGASLVRY